MAWSKLGGWQGGCRKDASKGTTDGPWMSSLHVRCGDMAQGTPWMPTLPPADVVGFQGGLHGPLWADFPSWKAGSVPSG